MSTSRARGVENLLDSRRKDEPPWTHTAATRARPHNSATTARPHSSATTARPHRGNKSSPAFLPHARDTLLVAQLNVTHGFIRSSRSVTQRTNGSTRSSVHAAQQPTQLKQLKPTTSLSPRADSLGDYVTNATVHVAPIAKFTQPTQLTQLTQSKLTRISTPTQLSLNVQCLTQFYQTYLTGQTCTTHERAKTIGKRLQQTAR